MRVDILIVPCLEAWAPLLQSYGYPPLVWRPRDSSRYRFGDMVAPSHDDLIGRWRPRSQKDLLER